MSVKLRMIDSLMRDSMAAWAAAPGCGKKELDLWKRARAMVEAGEDGKAVELLRLTRDVDRTCATRAIALLTSPNPNLSEYEGPVLYESRTWLAWVLDRAPYDWRVTPIAPAGIECGVVAPRHATARDITEARRSCRAATTKMIEKQAALFAEHPNVKGESVVGRIAVGTVELRAITWPSLDSAWPHYYGVIARTLAETRHGVLQSRYARANTHPSAVERALASLEACAVAQTRMLDDALVLDEEWAGRVGTESISSERAKNRATPNKYLDYLAGRGARPGRFT